MPPMPRPVYKNPNKDPLNKMKFKSETNVNRISFDSKQSK